MTINNIPCLPLRQYSIDAQPIPDKEIFYVDKRKQKEQLKSSREQELAVMKTKPSKSLTLTSFDYPSGSYFDALPGNHLYD